MISRLVICSSLAVLWGANVTGRVETGKGDAAVVWLQPATPATVATAAAANKAVIHQRNKTFLPHLLVVRSGDSVSFPNYDPFFHNAFSNYSGQVFDTGLYAPGTDKVIALRRPGVVRVFCNIHPTMSAVIVVVDTPYHAVTAKGGAFTILGVPAGEYTLHVFTERASDKVLEALQTRLTLVDGETRAIPVIRIKDEDFVPPRPHKNKFGKEYPAVIVDQYPGK